MSTREREKVRMATPIQTLINRCKADAQLVGMAILDAQATRAQEEYDSLLARVASQNECAIGTDASAPAVVPEHQHQEGSKNA